jgi:H+/Cl- antiporter ClcA
VRRPLAGRIPAVVVALGFAVPVVWLATEQPVLVGAGDRAFGWANGSSGLPVIAVAMVGAALVAVLVATDVTGGLVIPVHWLGGMVGIALAHTWLPSRSVAFAAVAGGGALLASACALPATAVALTFAACGWSAASWGAVTAVVVARVTSTTPWRPLVCS